MERSTDEAHEQLRLNLAYRLPTQKLFSSDSYEDIQKWRHTLLEKSVQQLLLKGLQLLSEEDGTSWEIELRLNHLTIKSKAVLQILCHEECFGQVDPSPLITSDYPSTTPSYYPSPPRNSQIIQQELNSRSNMVFHALEASPSPQRSQPEPTGGTSNEGTYITGADFATLEDLLCEVDGVEEG